MQWLIRKKAGNLTVRLLFFRGMILMGASGCLTALPGCAVVTAVDMVGTVAVKTVGLVADAAIGVVKITGHAMGSAVNAVVPGGD